MRMKGVLLSLGVFVWFAPSSIASSTVYVSATADEPSSSCTRSNPCKTITQALGVVSAGGVVDIVSSGVYDAFTVSHAVTVKADLGITPTINVLSTTGVGISISAGSTDDVTISGLTLRGPGTNATGININSGRLVTVENCDIREFAYGLAFIPTSGNTEFKVSGGTYSGSNTGIYTATSFGNAVVDGVTVYGGQAGIETAALYVTITNSRITAGTGPGLYGVLTSSGTAVLEGNVISRYVAGDYAGCSGGVTYLPTPSQAVTLVWR